MNDMKRTSDCCPSCCVMPPSPCTADCSLQRTPARKRAAPAPAAQPPSIGYVNVKHGTFHTLAQLAATERNGDLIASGEIVEVCPVVRGAAQVPRVAPRSLSPEQSAELDAALAKCVPGPFVLVAPEQASVRDALEIGATMGNVLYNLAQKPGHALTSDDVAMFDKLRKEWDAIRALISKEA